MYRYIVALGLLFLLAGAGVRADPRGVRTSPSVTPTGAFNRILVDNPRGRLYLDDSANGTVIAWNPWTNASVGSVVVGSGPAGMALSFDGSELYVALVGAHAIAVVNPDTLTVSRSIGLSAAPYDLAAGRPGRLYASTRETPAYVRIVDTAAGVELGAMTALTLPPDQLLAINANRTRLFVGDTSSLSADGYRIAIDGDNLTLDGLSGAGAWGYGLMDMVLSPDGSTLYLAEGICSCVASISTTTMEITQNFGPLPDSGISVALADRGGLIFVTTGRYGLSDSIFAMNSSTGAVLGSWPLGGYPPLMRAPENGTAAFVVVGTVNRTLVTIPTGFPPPSGSSLEATPAASTVSGLIPFSVSFYSAVTAGVPPYSYSWSFGDGGTSSSPAPVHTYDFVGMYRATLTVTDASGTTRTGSLPIHAGAVPIPVTITAQPRYGPPPLNVTFSAAIGGGRAPYSFVWSFGDGATSGLANPSHTYRTNGSYRASLTVTDSHGATGLATTNVTVAATSLEASIVSTVIVGPLPLVMLFRANVLGGEGPFAYEWMFDDEVSILPYPVHSFWLPGYHSVSLQVTDRHGNVGFARAEAQVTLGEPQNLTVLSAFPGLYYGHSVGGYGDNAAPPDPQVAAGAGFVFEMVNDQGRILDSDGRLLQDLNLWNLFGMGPSYVTDPKVLFDALSDRWFASIDTLVDGRIRIAVSAGPDPRGAWYRYALQSRAYPDQPILGIGGETVLVSVNTFSSLSPAVFIGSETWVINKTDLLFGLPLNFVHSGPDPNELSEHPARSLDATDESWMVSTSDTSATKLELWRWSGHPPSAVVETRDNLTIRPMSLPPSAREPGGTYVLDAGDTRVLDAVASKERMWISFDEGCTPPGDAVMRDCVRLIEVDLSKMSVLRDLDLAESTESLLYPALGIDGIGNVFVAFGYVSSTEYPGIRVAVLPAAGGPSAMPPPITIAPGLGLETASCDSSNTCRYGDYFAAATDPQAPLRVWTVGERGTTASWSTELAIVAFLDQARVSASYGPGPDRPPVPPWFEYALGGVLTNVTLSLTPQSYEVDRGGLWRAAAAVPDQGPGSRWALIGPALGLALIATNLTFNYREQFALSTASSQVQGGNVTPGTGWFDTGSSVELKANPAAGWAFEGWVGTGNGSYTGVNQSVTLRMTGPMTETAVFFPGLTIVATSGGYVRYYYGKTSGTVLEGTSRTLYLPPGTNVTLSAIPTGSGNVFEGWSGGPTGGPSGVVVNLSDPVTVVASFRTPLDSVLALWPWFTAGGALAVAAVVVLIWRRKRRRG